MGSRNRSKDGDEHDEDCPGGKGVAQQDERHILCKGLRHNAGADDRRHQKRGPQRFRENPPAQVESQASAAPLLSWSLPGSPATALTNIGAPPATIPQQKERELLKPVQSGHGK